MPQKFICNISKQISALFLICFALMVHAQDTICKTSVCNSLKAPACTPGYWKVSGAYPNCKCEWICKSDKEKCLSGQDSAIADYKKGIMKIYISSKRSETGYIEYCKKYGVEIGATGCIWNDEWVCYTKYMEEKIKGKYPDFMGIEEWKKHGNK